MRLRVSVAIALAAVTCTSSSVAAGPTPAPAQSIAPPSRAHGATVARIVQTTHAAWRLQRPGRGPRLAPETAWTGQPQRLLVLRSRLWRGRTWVRLRLASRPDGSAAWVRAGDVALSFTHRWVSVDRRARRVDVYDHGRLTRRFRAVVGAAATPTPPGLAAVYETDPQADPAAFDGAWVLQLTALSRALHSFDGGPGRVGIHGRGGASLLDPLGSARSHGCVRIDNAAIRWLAARATAGTPVQIH